MAARGSGKASSSVPTQGQTAAIMSCPRSLCHVELVLPYGSTLRGLGVFVLQVAQHSGLPRSGNRKLHNRKLHRGCNVDTQHGHDMWLGTRTRVDRHLNDSEFFASRL